MESTERDRKPSVVLPAGMELVVPPPAREEMDGQTAPTALRRSARLREVDGSEAGDGRAAARP
jgi:hypothetical protein